MSTTDQTPAGLGEVFTEIAKTAAPELLVYLVKAGADAFASGKVALPEGLDIGDVHRVRDVIPDPLPTTIVRAKIRADIAAAEAELRDRELQQKHEAEGLDFADTDPPPGSSE